jgi:NodT family efflux transporter outer membrane factor (OMF) lipoprotein
LEADVVCTDHDIQPSVSRVRQAISGAMPLVSLVLLLSACAVGPKYTRPPTPLNDNWSAKAEPHVNTQAAPNESWWKDFKDPALDQLIELAYHQNLPLQVAGLRIMESRAALGIAIGRQYPQVQDAFASATAVGLTQRTADNLNVNRNFWDNQVGFDAAWEADFWGKFHHDVQAHTASHLATVADYDNAVVSLTAEVARTYAVIRTFEVLVEQARTNAGLQEEGLRIADARFRHGATSELDVTQATALLETTRTSIPKLESSLQQSENALSTLLGQPTGSIQAVVAGAKGIPTAAADVIVSLPAELLRRRPDVRSAELLAIAQCARIGVAKADLYPRFVLFGSIGTEGLSGAEPHGSSLDFGNIFGAGSFFYSFGPRLIWPILNYGRLKNNIRVQDAQFQQTLVSYYNTVLKAAQEVEDALVGYLKSQEALVSAQKAVEAARRSVDLAIAQYREGAVDYQRVLDAERVQLQVENELTRTQSAIATNRIALYKALGGGWEQRKGDLVVPQNMQTQMQERTDWGDLLSKPVATPIADTAPSTHR